MSAGQDAAHADLQALFALFHAGRLVEMEAAAAALTLRHPQGGQAWKALGVARLAQGQDALAALQRAANLLPADAETASNLGRVLLARGRPEEAVASYRRAIRIKPDFAPAHLALGIVLKQLGQLGAAADSLRQATRWQPRQALGHDQLGVVLHAAGQAEVAVSSLREALSIQPSFAEAHFHLANALVDLGRHDEAVPAFLAALTLQPAQPEWQANLGVALLTLGRADEAVATLQQALALNPDMALVHSNLGNALMAQGRFVDALGSQLRALALAPGLTVIRRNLAHVLKTLGRTDEALVHLHAARAQEPDNLALRSECLFVQQYLEATPQRRRMALAEARDFGAAAAQAARPYTHSPSGVDPERKLRIGMVSADLRLHPVGYFIESVLAEWAARRADPLAIHLYANHPGCDALSQRLQAQGHAWRSVAGLDDASLARQIHDDGIDVLVDLSGHTRGNRLPMLAWRPAPVQLSWLGYCATTGLDAVDACLADRWTAPAGAEADFAESILRLPDGFLCFTPPEHDVPVGQLPASAAPGLCFGCFNHLAKINEAVVSLWSRVLRAVPGSSLLLQSEPLRDPAVCQQLRDRFARHGIAADRLRLRPAQTRADYLAAHREVDIALDPFPYPGGTTTCEALWMGVPVLTLGGPTALSRQGVSILRNLGLVDWIAGDEAAYVRLAQSHAADRVALAALRHGLRAQLLASPLCDARRFAGHLESAWRQLWRAWCTRCPQAGTPA